MAVKRIKSEKAIQERVKEAVKQIHGTGMRGVIVADLTVAMNPNNEPYTGLASDEQFELRARDASRRLLDLYADRMTEWVRGKSVRGVVVVVHYLRQHLPTGWSLETITTAHGLTPYNRRFQREFEDFFNQYRTALNAGS